MPPPSGAGRPRKKGFQPPSAVGGKEFLGPGLAALAALAILVALVSFTLKKQLVKPGRILDAAEDSGLYEKLPRLLFAVVIDKGRNSPAKVLKLKEPQIQAMADAVFTQDWVVGEIEAIVYDAADMLLSDEGGGRLTIELAEVKTNLVNAISKAVEQNADKVPICSSASQIGKALCKPKGIDDFTFQSRARGVVSTVVAKIPNSYPLLDKNATAGIDTLKGVLGSLGTAATVLLLLGLGLGAGAFFTMEDDSPSPIKFVGIGLLAGGVVLFMVTSGVKKAVNGGLEAAVMGLEASTRQVLTDFLDGAIGGGFGGVTILLVVAALAGGGLVFYDMQQGD